MELRFSAEPYTASLVEEFAQMEDAKTMCFACLCVERILMVRRCYAKPLIDLLEGALNECWHSLMAQRLPMSESSYMQLLDDALAEVLAEPEYSFSGAVAEDSIYAVACLGLYATTLDPVPAAWCGYYARNIAIELARQPFVMQRGVFYSHDVLLAAEAAEVVRIECQVQRNTLEQLKALVLDRHQLEQLRLQAQATGEQFAQKVDAYFAQLADDWQTLQSSYPVNSTIEGYIVFPDVEGVTIKLNDKTYGIARYEEGLRLRDWLGFMHHKVTAVVTGYDAKKRLLTLEGVQVHSEKA